MSGHLGEVTTPSVTGVQVLGESAEDCAFNVYIESVDRDAWFSRELLEFVDHAAGTTMTLTGIPKIWTRTNTGEWSESARRLPAREWWAWLRNALRGWVRR